MKRYYLQEGDGVDVTGSAMMLVMTGGRLCLNAFDVPALDLRFHWSGEAHAVGLDDRGFYVDVDNETYLAMSGLEGPAPAENAARADSPTATAPSTGGGLALGLGPNGPPSDGWLQAQNLGSWFALDGNGVMWQMPMYRWETEMPEPKAFDESRLCEAFAVPAYDEDIYRGLGADELPDFAALDEMRAKLERLRTE